MRKFKEPDIQNAARNVPKIILQSLLTFGLGFSLCHYYYNTYAEGTLNWPTVSFVKMTGDIIMKVTNFGAETFLVLGGSIAVIAPIVWELYRSRKK